MKNNMFYNTGRRNGFTLIEILMVIALIAILVTVVSVAMGRTRKEARDTRRKAELSQIGQMMMGSCFMPAAGAGEYDFTVLAEELKTKFPKYASQLSRVPRDPKVGSDTESHYRYVVNAEGKCALYANLEQESAAVTIPDISSPTPGKGKGVFDSSTVGPNGTTKYYQVSN